jgi:hypothetical protein
MPTPDLRLELPEYVGAGPDPQALPVGEVVKVNRVRVRPRTYIGLVSLNRYF